MRTLKRIGGTMVGLFQQARRFAQRMGFALKRRQRQFALNALEAERLDRIRNPSKYLGK